MNCVWTLVHLHVSRDAYVNNLFSNLVECVDFSDLSVALLWAGL